MRCMLPSCIPQSNDSDNEEEKKEIITSDSLRSESLPLLSDDEDNYAPTSNSIPLLQSSEIFNHDVRPDI